MGPFPPSDGKEYILVVVDYVSKWVEAIPSRTNDHRDVLRFVTRYIFTRYGCSRAIISDDSSHLNNAHLWALLKKYRVHHCVTTPYHPQANGQVEVSNREVQEHSKEDYSARWEGLGTQASRRIMGIPDGIHDTHWDVSLSADLRESLPPSD